MALGAGNRLTMDHGPSGSWQVGLAVCCMSVSFGEFLAASALSLCLLLLLLLSHFSRVRLCVTP